VVKMTSKECPKPAVCKSDSCLVSLRASSIEGRLEESIDFCDGFLRTQNDDVQAIPDYARQGCGASRTEAVIASVSSACACVPTVAVPELPRTTSRPPVPTVLPPKKH